MNRRQMARAVAKMSARGYRVRQQSGEFTHNPFTLRWNRKRVVVTFERVTNNESPAASPTGG